ncbi:C40 family peptidase [Aequorivita echinoideorum]|uniref:C40 family peptidase n=1 Tax=Aequorivita echinoideorum TaxID=1549647 RepID=A0ABS5S006_9FLAO|nr:C40 family peptidase [Aequorivita echinoideorum]MBT0606559.1 C40 family peptidase [Aequorivita echinoideorum]
MKKVFAILFFSFLLISCGSTKNTGKIPEEIIGSTTATKKPVRKVKPNKNTRVTKTNTRKVEETEDTVNESPKDTRENIIEFSKTFLGTRYKFGGTTEAGMDCSGLVYTAFKKEDIELPRISRDMATKGILISYKDIEEGDLVFFRTSRKNTITHVGLVVEAKRGDVKFIHSTTRAGVIISSMEEKYWKDAFVEVRRII